jgi:hypothetical protein
LFVRGISFYHFSIEYLEMFRQCGIFLFFILIHCITILATDELKNVVQNLLLLRQVFCICIINDCPKPVYRLPYIAPLDLYRMGVFFEVRVILIVFTSPFKFTFALNFFHMYSNCYICNIIFIYIHNNSKNLL